MLFEASVEGSRHRVEVQPRGDAYAVTIDGRTLVLEWLAVDGPFASVRVAGEGEAYDVGLELQPGGTRVSFPQGSVLVELAEASRAGGASVPRRPAGPARLTAPMPGRVVRVLVAAGESVEAAQPLVVVEAMKMENELRAPRAGRVEQVAVREGQAVEAGALLVLLSS